MTDLTYLPGLVPFTFAIYFIIVVLVYYRYYYQFAKNPPPTPSLKGSEDCHSFPASSDTTGQRAWLHFWQGRSIKIASQSCWESRAADVALFLFRVVCFCYFFGVVFLWGYVESDAANAFYFTLWNVDLICVYYLLASVVSGLGIFYGSLPSLPSTDENPTLQQFSNAVQILFEFTAGTAFFVTVVAFGTLDQRFVFWNVNLHFITSMSFLVEISLNKFSVRFEHIIFQISWAFLYLLFCWPMVASGALDDWPYFFLRTNTPGVFAWYIGLFIADILFYLLLYSLVWVKEKHLMQKGVKFENERETVSTTDPLLMSCLFA